MRRVTVRAVGLLGVGLWTGGGFFGPAQAASFDCAKAKAPIELLICATPTVNALDDRLKVALDAAVKRAGDGRAALLADHKRWLVEFPKTCGVTPPPVSPTVVTCVAAAYEQHMAQLAPAAPAAAPVVAVPSQPIPGPVVKLDHAQLPASGTQSTYFSVDGPGRITVRAESATGVALRLVDMISGPLAEAGEPGQRDGRIDALLDRGRYKLVLTGAEKATGTVALTVSSTSELNQPPPALAHDSGQTLTESLGEGQQRSYWITVGSEPVSLVAAGRAVADMRLWYDGTDLTAVLPTLRIVDLEPGKSQRILTIAGKIEPGRYKLTLYGGAPLRWPEAGAEMPMSLRLGIPKLAGLDFRSGTLGPTGVEQFIVPPPVDFARLELAAIAPAKLTAQPLQASGTAYWGPSAEISKLSRRPVANVAYTPGAQGTLITIEGAPGLPYTLSQFQRAKPGDTALPKKSAERLLTLLDTGTAGANFPLTALLYEGDTVIAGHMPELTATSVLRERLTLDGRNSLLFQVIDSGRYRLKTDGVPHFWSVYSALGSDAIPSEKAGQLDLEAGYYRLNLRPSSALTGPVDVILAGEDGDMTAPAPKDVPAPARLISFTVPATAANSYVGPTLLIAERADVPVGLAIYDLPLKLVDNSPPVIFTIAPDEAKTLTFENAVAGSVTVVDEAAKPVALTLDGKAAGTKANVSVGAHKLGFKNTAKTARSFRLIFEGQARAVPKSGPVFEPVRVENPRLTAGQTYAADFSGGAPWRFDVLVEEPGLYRFETLGRLAMETRLKTRLLASLAQASENGIGHNAVLEQYLRAGLYQLEVASLRGTVGRAHLSLSRARLTEGETLQIDQPARVGLARGTGAILPFTVERDGRYSLHVLSLAQSIGFRLEDAEGWPVLPLSYQPEPFGEAGSKLTVPLTAGQYRLVLLPPPLATRALVRLTPEGVDPAPPEGHGPHPLALNGAQDFRWFEPAQPDLPRVPDQWEFSLPGPTRLKLALTEGMVGQLEREQAGAWAAVGAVSNAVPFDQTVAGGRYRLSLTALARNNRLGYRLTSATEQILPDQPRLVTLPTRQSFSLDVPQTVRLSSFGTKDVKAVLRDSENRIIAQADDRQNDWNFVIVRALAAGSYSLSVEPVTPPPAGVLAAEDASAPAYDGEGEGEYYEGDGEVSDESDAPPALEDAGLIQQASLAAGAVEVNLTYLPETTAAPITLAVGSAQTVRVAGTQAVLPLTLPAGQGLTLIEAGLGSELLLSLERQSAQGGAWETLAQASGPAPMLAFLPGAETYRLRAVALGALEPRGRPLTLRQSAVPAQALGEALNFVPQDGSSQAVARLSIPGAAVVDLGGAAPELLSVSGASGVGKVLPGALLLPEGEDLWLVRAQTENRALTPRLLAPAPDAPLSLRLSGSATVAVPPVPEGRIQLWQADAPQGQPFLALGGAAGIAPGSAVALGSEPKLRVGAVGAAAMPMVTLTRHLLTSPGQTEALLSAVALTLNPRSSRELRLPAGLKRLTLDLPAGLVADTVDGLPLLWSGAHPLSRQIETRTERLRLFNPGTTPAAIALRQMPIPGARLVVGPQQSFKQFLGAAGSFVLAVDGLPGQVLIVEGASGASVWQGKDGSVARGKRIPIQGPGVLTVNHPAGLLAVWLEGAGAGFWPALKTQTVQLPGSLPLSGAAQAVRLTLTEPSLLHLRSSAPLIAGLRAPGGAEVIRLFPNGVDWHRYVPAGEIELRLAAPQEGTLSGTLELQASPVTPVGEGLSPPMPLAAGDTRAFAFTVPRAARIGVGVRSARDPASVRLLDAGGRVLGEGLVQYKSVPAGDYVLEVQAPSDAALSLQAAVVGIAAPNRGPPPDVQQSYLDLVGLRANAP
jgi:uncharacterized protein